MKNKYVASFLSFFTGGIGAHKFYLGDNKKGFVYLAFSWTGFPALMGIFESIKILKLSENDFETYYKEYIRYYDTASKDWDNVKKDIKNNNIKAKKVMEGGFGDLKESLGWIDTLYELKRDGIITDRELQEKKKQLESLFKLKSDKILTDQEYQEKKDAILNRTENIFSYTKISDPEITIQNGDIIIGIGDHVVSESTKDQKVLEDFFISWNPNDPILIKVLRGGIERELNIPFEHIPIEPSFSGDSHSSGSKNLSNEEFFVYNDDLSFLGMCDNYIEYLNEKRLMEYPSDQKNQNTINFEQTKNTIEKNQTRDDLKKSKNEGESRKTSFPNSKNLIPGLVKLRTLWDNKSSMDNVTYEKEKGFAYLEASRFLMMGEEVVSDNDYQNEVQKEVSKNNKVYIFILFLIGFVWIFPDSWLATADYDDITLPFVYLIFQVLTFIFGRMAVLRITRDQDKALKWTLFFLLTNTIALYMIFGLSIFGVSS